MRGQILDAMTLIIPSSFVLLFVILLVMAIRGNIQEENDWREFKRDNHCYISGHIASSSGYGFTSSGKAVFLTTAPKDIWKCDNNFTEERDAE